MQRYGLAAVEAFTYNSGWIDISNTSATPVYYETGVAWSIGNFLASISTLLSLQAPLISAYASDPGLLLYADTQLTNTISQDGVSETMVRTFASASLILRTRMRMRMHLLHLYTFLFILRSRLI